MRKECSALTDADWFGTGARVERTFESIAERLMKELELIDWTLNATTRPAVIERLEVEFEKRKHSDRNQYSRLGMECMQRNLLYS